MPKCTHYTGALRVIDFILHAEYIFCVQFTQADSSVPGGRTVVIADDLSGAAECASEFAPPGGSTCLRLSPGPSWREAATVVWDLDARETPPVLSDPVLASIEASRRTYVKIDSLLRGNWAALVAALVRAAGRPALMCPALPRLGRGLQGGFIDLAPGHGLVHYTASAVDGLQKAGVRAGLHRLDASSPAALREGLLAAMSRHAVTVVDARTDAELDAMARVLEAQPAPYVAIGSAGLAGALARAMAIPRGLCTLGAVERMAVLVGSRTGPARGQLSQLAQASGEPVRWWHPVRGLEARPVGEALQAPLCLFATRPDDSAVPAGRELTRRFVEAVTAACPPVDTYVATGGETARALCDALGLDHLDILGQLEPGVCLARLPLPAGAKHLVIKSGSFGDPATLERVARMGGVLPALTIERNA